MKKTLILAITLLGASLHTQANTIINTKDASDNGGNNYYGFTCKLTDTFFTTTGDALDTQVILESLTIDTRIGSGSGGEFKVAVYEHTTDGTVGDFVTISENSVTWAHSSSLTLTFGDTVTIETGKQYKYLFVNSSATAASLTDLSTEGATLLSNYQSAAVGESLRMRNFSSLPSGDGTYKSNGLNSWESSYMPVVSFTVAPEPATATLSLLALAGLCIRRRRA